MRELLQQALDMLGPDGDLSGWTDAHYDALRAALAQPDARPVLWVPPEREGEFHHDHSSVTGYRNRMAGWVPLYATPQAQPAPAPEELSPEFTDTARAALLWVLWHHQGASSAVGQSIRFALGMGAHDRLNEHQIAEAKRWATTTGSTTAEFHKVSPAPAVPDVPEDDFVNMPMPSRERREEFERLCNALPPDVCWGDPITADIVRSIIVASTAAPAVRERDNDCTPNHYCNGRIVHLPDGEMCERCGHE